MTATLSKTSDRFDDRGRPLRKGPEVRLSLATALGGLAVITSYFVGLGWAMANANFDIWGGMLIAPFLVAPAVPIAGRVAAREGDTRLARLVVWAMIFKLGASLVRYAVAFQVYSGVADAGQYDQIGRGLGEAFRHGNFDLGPAAITGTRFIEILTGVVYAIIGPTKLGAFFVFAWMGFWGLYLFWRAFRIAFPDGDQHRYALLLFFLPSLLFWPSSIGKESWMMLTIGLSAYGAARILAKRRGGYPLLGLGLWGAAMVRPHVALIVIAALVIGYAARRAPRVSLTNPMVKVAGLAVMIVATVVILGQVETKFNVDSVSTDSVSQVLEHTESQTTQGGSQYQVAGDHSLIHLPEFVMTVLFRPWPPEAVSTEGIVSSLEGLFLLLVAIASLRRLARIPEFMRTAPYVTLALVYVLGFCFVFASIGNFGILVRQRVQVYPFLLVLFAIPLKARVVPYSQQLREARIARARSGASSAAR